MARQYTKPTIGQDPYGSTALGTWDNLDGRLLNVGYDVREYGATGNGSTDDGAAIAAAVTACQSAGGGVVYFPAGIYLTSQTITVYGNVTYQGAGMGATTVRLKTGSNVDLFKTDQFSALDGVGGAVSPARFAIRGMTLDGNAVGQSSGYTLSTYGTDFLVENVRITGGKTGGWRARYINFSGDTTGREVRVRGVKIFNNSGIQLDWQGPSDCQFSDIIVFVDSTFSPTYVAGSKGVLVSTANAGGAQFNNIHVWGFHEEAFHASATTYIDNGVIEGGKVNLWIDSTRCRFAGTIFGTGGTGPAAGTEVGVRIGTSPSGFQGAYHVTGINWHWASGDHPIEYAADAGGHVRMHVQTGTATAAWFGSRNTRGQLHIVSDDHPEFCEAPAMGGIGAPAAGMGVVGSRYHRFDSLTTSTTDYLKTATNTWTPSGVPRVTTGTGGGTITPSADTQDVVRFTAVSAAVTLNAPTGTPVDGQQLVIELTDNGTARAITHNAAYISGPAALATTTVVSTKLREVFEWDAGLAKWQRVL